LLITCASTSDRREISAALKLNLSNVSKKADLAIAILRPLVRNLPQFGFLEFLIGGFALSLLSGGVKMIFASFFVP
jgi:hypothetical protein